MIRSFASQLPRVTSVVATSYNGGGARQLSETSVEEGSRPLNKRLEVDLHELTNMQYLDEVTLIDVRQPTEHSAQQHIPGSLHIPLGNLREAFKLSDSEWKSKYNIAKPTKGSQGIIFYARGPIASSAAVEIAHKLGYRKSRHYAGGMQDYCLRNNISLKKPAPVDDTNIKEFYNYHYYNPDLHYL